MHVQLMVTGQEVVCYRELQGCFCEVVFSCVVVKVMKGRLFHCGRFYSGLVSHSGIT